MVRRLVGEREENTSQVRRSEGSGVSDDER